MLGNAHEDQRVLGHAGSESASEARNRHQAPAGGELAPEAPRLEVLLETLLSAQHSRSAADAADQDQGFVAFVRPRADGVQSGRPIV
jgi:hypothetical protein